MTTVRIESFTCGDCRRCYEDRDGDLSQTANDCDMCWDVICMACSPAHGCNPNDRDADLIVADALDELRERRRNDAQAEAIAEALWQILDDIDTYADMAKGDHERFYLSTMKAVEKRHAYLRSDGYKLHWDAYRTSRATSAEPPTWAGFDPAIPGEDYVFDPRASAEVATESEAGT